MSYILDALRKAAEQRGATPTVLLRPSTPLARGIGGRRAPWIAIATVVVLINAAVLAVLLRPGGVTAPAAPRNVEAQARGPVLLRRRRPAPRLHQRSSLPRGRHDRERREDRGDPRGRRRAERAGPALHPALAWPPRRLGQKAAILILWSRSISCRRVPPGRSRCRGRPHRHWRFRSG